MKIMKHVKNFEELNEEWDPKIEKNDKLINRIAEDNEKLKKVINVIDDIMNKKIKTVVQTDKIKLKLTDDTKVVLYSSETAEPGDAEGETWDNGDSTEIFIMMINDKRVGEYGYITSETYYKLLKKLYKFINS